MSVRTTLPPPASAVAKPERSRPRKPTENHRRDIQGLRAVAVLLVVLNHCGVKVFGGGYVGVDVFFVLSGFLITGQLLSFQQRDGKTSLTAFYARRARRILPAATLVIIVTAITADHLLNYVRAGQVFTDAVWSGFFLANVHFAAVGTDYFASSTAHSPLQHFWSLAVEEQFYLVWPAALAATFGIARLFRVRATRLLCGFLGVVVVASLAYSAVHTSNLPADAYFSTLTRAWELAIGAMLAVALPQVLRLPASAAATLGWLGLGAIIFSAVLFNAGTPFPGTAALLPVLGSAAVIAAGARKTPYGPSTLLARQPLRFVGDISYSLYLWHWPILTLAAARAGHDLPVDQNLTLAAAAVLLSALTYLLVENPIRRSRHLSREHSHALILWPAAVAAVVLVSLFGRDAAVARGLQRSEGAVLTAPAAGTGATPAGPVAASVTAALNGAAIPAGLTPSVEDVAKDQDLLEGCATDTGTAVRTCSRGDGAASRSIAVIGDSHAQMWIPAFDRLGQKYGYTVHPFVKHQCTSADVTLYNNKSDSSGADFDCNAWRTAAFDQIKTLHPSLVVISTRLPNELADGSGRPIPDASVTTAWQQGIESSVRQLQSAGMTVAVFTDAPGVAKEPTDCLLGRKATLATCMSPVDGHVSEFNAATLAGARAGRAKTVDVVPWLCSGGQCPTVIGNLIAYSDHGHISRTYAVSLSDEVAKALALDRHS